jgi:ABC-type bacteriocin/lantibiotic exporter with double-glycine peptidase domain
MIRLSGVSLYYKGNAHPALYDVSLELERGMSVALVGATGAGKSTLMDVIAGVAQPDEGFVQIGGYSPTGFRTMSRERMAYVPQRSEIVQGSIRENVALWVPRDQVDDDKVWAALEKARLADLLREARDGIDTVVGEHGHQLSGGQRQRLGLARAFFTSPQILLLDEATSALDAVTEAAISESVWEVGRGATVILAAHRLATVQRCELVIYMHEGEVVASGTFDKVREMVPHFAEQARLMGL